MDILVYVIAIALTVSFGVLSGILFKDRWWFWNSIVWFVVLVFLTTDIMQQELIPKDLPIALYSNNPIAEEQIVCQYGLANKYIIVEGDYLFCKQTLKPKPGYDNSSFATFTTIKDAGVIKKVKEVASGPGVTEFTFMVPKTEEFSFLLEATTAGKTVTVSSTEDQYSLEGWFTIRNKKEASAYISELQLFMIATIVSLSGMFFTMNQMREMWQGRKVEDEPGADTLGLVSEAINFPGVR